MKKTYYLFNPGQLERKDNTLKFTPVAEDGSLLLNQFGIFLLNILGILVRN